MFRAGYRIFAATLILIFSHSVHAEISARTADRLLKLSGTTEQVQSYPEVFRASLVQANIQAEEKIPRGVLESVLAAVDDIVAPDEITAGLSASLAKQLSPEEAEYLLEWYSSRSGMEITTGEIFASSAESVNYIMNNRAELMQDERRVAMAKKLDKLSGATDMSLELSKYSMVATFATVSMALQPDAPLDLKALEAHSKDSVYAARTDIESFITASLVFSYRDIPYKTLEEYIAFNQAPITQNYLALMTKGLFGAMETVITRLAVRIGEALQANSQAS